MGIYLLFQSFRGGHSVVKTVLYLDFLYTNDDSDIFTYRLNLKDFASLFFLTQDNFMF